MKDLALTLEPGVEVQTEGFVHVAGVPKLIHRKMISIGALTNATLKAVPHGIAGINVTGRIIVREFWTSNGVLSRGLDPDITVTVSATDVNVTPATDLSTYANTFIVLEYTKA